MTTRKKLFTNYKLAKQIAKRRGVGLYKLSSKLWFVGKYDDAMKAARVRR